MELTVRERLLVVEALRVAPLGMASSTEDELTSVATKIACEGALAEITRITRDIQQQAEADTLQAMVDMVRVLRNVCGSMAEGLGGVLGIALLLADAVHHTDLPEGFRNLTDSARSALLTWKQAEVQIDELLKAVAAG